ncbi:hypothetical protein [Microbulbifer pacificus]|uniref:Uncharacterized protein n=1 Tax=Microbulbifer pacificus TaxID=407164 RepID=A0AAU0MZV4_9GAMM|nr:hypothetical protein [Microbulbifer pacificus]WOX05745.1 hypothetical protein R5R33_00950 [Microbulbifer pacificus]
MKRRYLLFFTLLTLSVHINAKELDGSQPPSLEDYKIGEKWVWKYKGVTTSGEVRAEGKDTKKIVSHNGVLSMATQHAVIPVADIVKPVESKTARYNWPLQVGKKWKFEERWTSEDGTKGATIQDAEVLSFKEETVEAGTFMAYTIRYNGTISNSRGYSADTEDIRVYAARLKTFIKLTQLQGDYSYTEELIEYAPE